MRGPIPFDDVPIVDEHGRPAEVARTARPKARYDEEAARNAIDRLVESQAEDVAYVEPAHVMSERQKRILACPIPAEAYDTSREGGDSSAYVPAWLMDHVASRVFEDQWNTEVLDAQVLFQGKASLRLNPDRPGTRPIERQVYRVVAQARVRVTVVGPDGRVQQHSAVGVSAYDEFYETSDVITPYRIALKGAVTDARRTALQNFGRVFAPLTRDRDALAETLRQQRDLETRAIADHQRSTAAAPATLAERAESAVRHPLEKAFGTTAKPAAAKPPAAAWTGSPEMFDDLPEDTAAAEGDSDEDGPGFDGPPPVETEGPVAIPDANAFGDILLEDAAGTPERAFDEDAAFDREPILEETPNEEGAAEEDEPSAEVPERRAPALAGLVLSLTLRDGEGAVLETTSNPEVFLDGLMMVVESTETRSELDAAWAYNQAGTTALASLSDPMVLRTLAEIDALVGRQAAFLASAESDPEPVAEPDPTPPARPVKGKGGAKAAPPAKAASHKPQGKEPPPSPVEADENGRPRDPEGLLASWLDELAKAPTSAKIEEVMARNQPFMRHLRPPAVLKIAEAAANARAKLR